MQQKFNKTDIEIIADKTVYDGYFKVHQLQLRHQLFKGGVSPVLTREVVFRANSVGILLYDPNLDKVVLVEQLRMGPVMDEEENPWLLEIVAGMIESNQTPESVAQREAKEEADCVIKELIPIGRCYLTPGSSAEIMWLYCGIIDSQQIKEHIHGLKEEGEDIFVHIYSREEAYQLLTHGKIISAPAIMTLQWLQLNIKSLAN